MTKVDRMVDRCAQVAALMSQDLALPALLTTLVLLLVLRCTYREQKFLIKRASHVHMYRYMRSDGSSVHPIAAGQDTRKN